MLKTSLAGELPKPNAGTQQDMGKHVTLETNRADSIWGMNYNPRDALLSSEDAMPQS